MNESTNKKKNCTHTHTPAKNSLIFRTRCCCGFFLRNFETKFYGRLVVLHENMFHFVICGFVNNDCISVFFSLNWTKKNRLQRTQKKSFFFTEFLFYRKTTGGDKKKTSDVNLCIHARTPNDFWQLCFSGHTHTNALAMYIWRWGCYYRVLLLLVLFFCGHFLAVCEKIKMERKFAFRIYLMRLDKIKYM